jgi:hypothetical protein
MTKRKIIESIQRILKGGDIRSSTELTHKDVEMALNRAISTLLKMETINVTMPFGSYIPTHHMIATYEGIEVTDIPNGRSKATLPATPMSLPMNVGIFRITSDCCPEPFIPLEAGMLSVAQGVNRISAMLGQDLVAYEAAGKQVTFNRKKDEIGTVTMQLLVMDIESIDEDAELPLPPDLENAAVNLVLQQFGQWRPGDDSADNNDKA